MHLYYAGRTKIIKLLSCVCVSVSVYTKSMYNSRLSKQKRNINIIPLFSNSIDVAEFVVALGAES